MAPERIEAEVNSAIEAGVEFHLRRDVDIARLAEIACTRLGGFAGERIGPDELNVLHAYGVDPGVELDSFAALLERSARRGT